MKTNKNTEEWTYEDLLSLPKEESDRLEYKSSKIILDDLKNKISIAASSFWNSGGGVLIAGVDDNGVIDGGIPNKKGRQSIRDWVDNAIKLTEPIEKYKVWIIEHKKDRPEITEGNVILIIEFYKSNLVPHIAYDNKYYIRAGAHSASATHFQIEALRSLRQFSKPNIKGILRTHPNKPMVEELLIVALNDAVALDIKLDLNPLPLVFEKMGITNFPLEIPFVDKNNPFRMDIFTHANKKESFGEKPIKLILEFKDVLHNVYEHEQIIFPSKNIQPVQISKDTNLRLVEAIEKLEKKIK